MNQTTAWDNIKYKVYALILIAIILFAGSMSALAYNKTFASSIPVTLKADRAGLQMHPGNRVKVQGVDFGRVKSVDLTEEEQGVDVLLYVDPDLAEQVPANVEADLNQLTAFGNKTVELILPAHPSPERLEAGSVIQVRHVAGEVNRTFDELMTLLNRVEPAKLNATLGAFAQTFEGNGDRLGKTLTKANNYLTKFNRDLPALQRDFRISAGFANVYAGAAPDIADVLSNAGVVMETFADGDWPFVIHGAGFFGDRSYDFFDQNADGLIDALDSLRPTTSLLKEYSPALTCFLDGTANTFDSLTAAFQPGGIMFEAPPAPPSPRYQYPRDLPVNGPGPLKGPNCRGLPTVGPEELWKAGVTNGPPSVLPGRESNRPNLSKEPAVVQFFGPDALLLPAVKGGN
ncbi:MCE family protein [Pseudonocardia eucalypti]|uniref:MCE family protein n=1 Tax=Pseudonocardia eucalypti TaxID=648755 RepID=A0ABP9QJI5_9PSEU|nr:phospholipid/cholesterol/gamma-HCH transport system substrate-binding protein [Pseudonocardia eucalypti]